MDPVVVVPHKSPVGEIWQVVVGSVAKAEPFSVDPPPGVWCWAPIAGAAGVYDLKPEGERLAFMVVDAHEDRPALCKALGVDECSTG